AVNKTSNFTLTFTTATAMPVNGDIDIIFPVGFDLTSIGSGDASEADSDGGTLTTSVNGHRMTINTGTGSSGGTEFALTIANLKNPSNYGSYGTFAIQTQDASDVTLDTGTGNTIDIVDPSTLIVTKLADTNDGTCNSDCSLREAITDANSFGDNATIQFKINTCYSATCTIAPTSALPAITVNNLLIDGYTQVGASANSATYPAAMNSTVLVVLDGTGAGGGSEGIDINGGNANTVRGLSIVNFSGYGVLVRASGTNNKIQGNYIGVWNDGTTALGNVTRGVRFESNSNYLGIDGDGVSEAAERNIIASTSGGWNIDLAANSNIVAGNFIGVDKDG
ncbi:hypothetical protein BVY03_01345, partial [bacterium K02(2017)]